MKLLKRKIAMLMILMLVFSLTACAQTETPSVTTSGTSAAVTPGSTATTAATTTSVQVKATIHIFGSRSVNSPEDWNTMDLVKKWSKEVNVVFEWELVATGYNDKKALMLASGNWPDVIMTVTDEEQIRYGSEGVFIPLQDLQKKYAPKLMAKYAENPQMLAYNTAPDGNIYAFPFYSIGPWGGINRLQVINTTWLKNLNLKMPTTLQEYKNVLIAFRDGDPNGNKIKDEVPMSWAGALSGTHPSGWAFAPDFTSASFQCPYPYNADHMDYRNGKVTFIPATEEYRNWVRWMGEMYAEGLLDKQGFTQGTDQYAAKLNSTPYTVGVAAVWDIGDNFTSPDAYNHYDFIPPLKGLKGENPVVQYNLGYGGRGKWAITKSCKNPEAVMRAADYCFEPDISVQFLEGPIDVRLVPCDKDNIGALKVGPAPTGMDNTTFRDSVALFSATPAYIGLDLYAKRLHLHYTDHKVNYINTILKPYADPDPMPPFFMSIKEVQTKTEVWTDLCDYVNRTGAEFVINNDIDKKWDNYLAELDKIGYKKVVVAQQAAVDRAKKN